MFFNELSCSNTDSYSHLAYVSISDLTEATHACHFASTYSATQTTH